MNCNQKWKNECTTARKLNIYLMTDLLFFYDIHLFSYTSSLLHVLNYFDINEYTYPLQIPSM